MQSIFEPKKIIITKEASALSLTKTILGHCPSTPVEYIEDLKPIDQHPDLAKKTTLVITSHPGRFYKPCPGTLNYLCCRYKILNIGLGCPMSCTYCILQSYLKHQAIFVHANIDNMLTELDQLFSRFPGRIFRLGTGEFTDSLALDHLTDLSRILIPYFAKQERAYLEIKTKTDNIRSLEHLDPQGKIIMAWSLNTQRIVGEEESGTSSIEERLSAAKKCQDWGYKLAFHFDPIILYPGWEAEYQEIIEKLFSKISPSQVAWISLGCFRFMPGLKPIIQERFPKSLIIYQEFIRGLDGKMRYLGVIRQEIYVKMASWIRRIAPHCLVYLCMESPKIWEYSLGCTPGNNLELQAWLDQRCGLHAHGL